VDTKKAI